MLIDIVMSADIRQLPNPRFFELGKNSNVKSVHQKKLKFKPFVVNDKVK